MYTLYMLKYNHRTLIGRYANVKVADIIAEHYFRTGQYDGFRIEWTPVQP